jgi:uncharacterized protein (DUF1499 family)
MSAFTITLLCILLLEGANAWSNSQWRNVPGRDLGNLQSTRADVLVTLGTTALSILVAPTGALAVPPKKPPPYVQERGSLESGLSPCPGQPMKKSCWSSEDTEGRRVERWVPPASLQGKAAAIAAALEATMATYPQEGQNDVDRGGWTKAECNTDGKGGTYLRYEFTSGKFKYIDELELLVDGNTGKVSVRTASRSAGFDYNVNATRLNYIQKDLQKQGWKVALV